MARTGSPASRHVAAVERAVTVLDALAAAGELGTNEVARRTGLNASTASRQLATLAAAGLVAHVEGSGRYRLGPRLVELGNAALAGLDVRELARPHLRALAEQTGETATLSVPGDPDAITVDFVQSSASVQSVARLGRPSVGHATAAGKVVLAFGDAALPAGELLRFTAATITDRAALAAELDGVRRRGFAQALREREDDLNAVAVPVLGGRGELVAVVGVQGPASRFTEDAIGRALGALRDHAEAVSRALGGVLAPAGGEE
jgi:IclR family acetate operon transcriptional repressor